MKQRKSRHVVMLSSRANICLKNSHQKHEDYAGKITARELHACNNKCNLTSEQQRSGEHHSRKICAKVWEEDFKDCFFTVSWKRLIPRMNLLTLRNKTPDLMKSSLCMHLLNLQTVLRDWFNCEFGFKLRWFSSWSWPKEPWCSHHHLWVRSSCKSWGKEGWKVWLPRLVDQSAFKIVDY